jgi:molecular chaperone GrpE
MTDETTQAETEGTAQDDDIEVKWRKKSSRPAPPPIEPAASDEDVATLKRELETERQRVKDLQDRWQRAAADLVNLRRRTEQDRGEMEKFASMLLVQEILPVLDNFERALATIPGNLAMLTWIQGVMLIERHLRAILERQGLEAIEAQGKQFSPHFHEAVSEVETEEQAPGIVVREYQRGYTMHGRVIRPTLVEIAKAPVQQQQPERAPQENEPAPEETDEQEGEEIAEEAATENIGP